MITIVDYGMANLRSVHNKFRRIGVACNISSDSKEIIKADKLILPGVGHYKYGMSNLNELGLIDILNQKVLAEKTPILGICLGTQLFAKHSEEGDCEGLGWIDAEDVAAKIKQAMKFGRNIGREKILHLSNDNIAKRIIKIYKKVL